MKIRVLENVLFNCSVMSDSLRPCGLQHTRCCPSPTPRAYSNSCASSQWCHPIISSSVVPFSSCLQSFPASGSFPVTHFFTSGGQSIGVSASASVLAMNIQDWFYLGLDWWDLLAIQGTLKSLLQHQSSKASILWCSAFFIVQLSHPYMTTGKIIALTRWTFVSRLMSLLFNMLSDFPGGSDGKASVYNAGDPGLIPGLGRSPGEGNGNPLQYYCLENPMDRRAW